MRRYAEGTRVALQKLFLSGMNGQLHEGDTIGIWTFNEDLYSGRYPLQLWKEKSQKSLAAGIDGFLQHQSFEKQSHLEKVMPTLFRLVKESEKITIVLVSNGDAKMVGTPFDRNINQIYESSRDALEKLHDPFLTVLRAQRGAWIGYSVTWSPWPVEFPRFLPEPQKPVELPMAEVKMESKPEPKPLIVIGKKPEPPTPTAASQTTETPNEAITALRTQEPTSSQKSELVEKSGEPVSSESLKAETEVAKPAVEGTIEHATEATEPTQVHPGETVKTSPSTETAIAKPQVNPVQTAVALPTETKSHWSSYLAVGLVAIIAALGLAFLLMRHDRKTPSASLITRSMDKEK